MAPVLDHLGIAVADLEQSLEFYRRLGFEVASREDVPQEGVRAAMLPLADSRLELLAPTRADSAIARFLAHRGPGLHHVALRVHKLAEVVARLRQAGVRLAQDQIQTGAGGHAYIFLHPSSAGGVLIELVEEEAAHAG